jgi:hypothetical protein
MEERIVLGVVIILSVSALFFIGSGITSMVISESCCFGPNCSPENLCDAAKPHPEQPASIQNTNIYIGIILLITLMIFLLSVYGKYFTGEHHKHN